MADTETNLASDAYADLEELGCGDLVLALAKAIRPLQPQQVLKVRALDPGALVDIPAWCRMRGHQLLRAPQEQAAESIYYIRKGES